MMIEVLMISKSVDIYPRYPKSATYILRSRQVQPEGFQYFIFDLNIYKDEESLISSGTSSHVFGPLYLIVSRPLFTVFALGIIQSFLPRTAGVNISLKTWGHKLCLTLYISIASFCKFLSWIVKDLSISKSCWKVKELFLYITLNALSCRWLILWLSSLLWHIQTRGQKLNWDSTSACYPLPLIRWE